MNFESLSLGVIVLLVDLCLAFDFLLLMVVDVVILIAGVGILFDSEEELLVFGVEVLEGSEELLLMIGSGVGSEMGSGMGSGLGMGSGEDVILVI